MLSQYLKYATFAYGNSLEPFYADGASSVHFYDANEKKRADVQFFTIEKEDELIFAIRGSQSTSDFIDDSYCWTENFQDVSKPGVRVHAGFLKQYLSMRSAMISAVFRMVWKKQVKKIIFTGHSLGGAISTLCGAAVKDEIPELDVSVITFGSPRVGNKLFTQAFKDVKSVRCVNGSDIVPTMPYWGYDHVHGEICIGVKSSPNIHDHLLSSYATSYAESRHFVESQN
jgi:triacylglycerol lipase